MVHAHERRRFKGWLRPPSHQWKNQECNGRGWLQRHHGAGSQASHWSVACRSTASRGWKVCLGGHGLWVARHFFGNFHAISGLAGGWDGGFASAGEKRVETTEGSLILAYVRSSPPSWATRTNSSFVKLRRLREKTSFGMIKQRDGRGSQRVMAVMNSNSPLQTLKF